MKHAVFCWLLSTSAFFSVNLYAALAPNSGNSSNDETPMVLSYAEQPVSKFNQALLKATLSKDSWANSPDSISQRYSGADFEMIKSNQVDGKVITYNMRPSRDGHPQLLLILALDKQGTGWKVSKAGLSWRCQNDAFYGTNNCRVAQQDSDD
ncbi:hypothetical protein JYB87_05460 [Shewanella avicenniae]|uniref:DUF3828 domain-containing protein n=1 Tax=Shewanella avicenniae TaxID=2814294 RepID=A0ABX7QVL5_9GAMM|nr:hypothetical protein [Shewanella avicenniae]QSX34685.1 hypothetical protein JYB87_05460 [Shewanella avicenniae]